MGPGITWYDILGVLPDASSGEIQQAYDAKADLLRPELISGAPPQVDVAAAGARGILGAALRVLGDPVNRERYDEAAGIRVGGEGLGQPGHGPLQYQRGLLDYDVAADDPGAEALVSLTALNDWLARQPDRPRRILVPEFRGLFYDVFLDVAGKLGLHITTVRLTKHPMPVDGLVVDQSPGPSSKIHRSGTLTVQVWHPAARVT